MSLFYISIAEKRVGPASLSEIIPLATPRTVILFTIIGGLGTLMFMHVVAAAIDVGRLRLTRH